MDYQFSNSLWLYAGQAAWHFIILPKDISSEIKEIHGSSAAGFGSIKVKVHVGASEWATSIFPDSKSGCYLLPLKKSVRVFEHILAGDTIRVKLTVIN